EDLVADNPDQQGRAAKVRAAAGRLLDWLAATEALVPGTGPKQLKARVNDPEGHRRLAALQTDLDDFLRAERRLDEERGRALDETHWQLTAVLLAGGLGTCVTTVVLAVVFTRGV